MSEVKQEVDAWEKCPICFGSGFVFGLQSINSTQVTCPTCLGRRIISKFTGLPPNYIQYIPPAPKQD